MVDAIAAPLYLAARATTESAPLQNRATPNVAQENGKDDFPPETSQLVFTPATQGRFADTDSFIAVAQSAGENFNVFGGGLAQGYGSVNAAQELNGKLDQLLKDLEA